MKKLKQLILFVNIIFAILLALAYRSPETIPTDSFFVPLMGLVYPVLLIINVLFFVGWVFFDYKLSLVSLLTILFGGTTLFTFVNWNFSNSYSDSDIKIMSYNLKNNYEVLKDSLVVENLLDYLDNQDVDFMAFQECGPFFLDQLNKGNFQDYNKISHKKYRVVILSKYKVIDQGFIKVVPKHFINGCLWVDLDINGKRTRVYNIHMASNTITDNVANLVKNKKILSESTFSEINTILTNTRAGSILRINGMKNVVDHMNKSPYPTIVMGDFNDTPTSYSYNQIKSRGLTDSFLSRGSGVGTTFREKIPLLRIDYIFYDKMIECESFHVGNVDYSDHYPIFGAYSIKQN